MSRSALETGWLEEARREARAVFEKTEPPAKTVETWRRVDFNAWRLNLLGQAGASGPAPLVAASPVLGGAAGVLTQADDAASLTTVVDPELVHQGVLLMGLEDAASRHPELVEPYLGSLQAAPAFRKLEAASLARFHGGAFLYVPAGLRVEKPFEFSFLHSPENVFSFPRVLVIAESGTQISIIESHLACEEGPAPAGSKSSSIVFSRLVAKEGARVSYAYEQTLPPGTSHFWHQQADLAQDVALRHYSVLLGSAVHKSELDVRLNGVGAESELYGILFGTKNQTFDPHTAQWHSASRSTSDLLFRSALRDRARAIYTGLIRIEAEAKGCEAFQQNDNRLLSNDARADTTPVLEILTDEVRCKHGATIGPVNPDELFYLCSRGLDPLEASRILILGFFDPILNQLPERLRERLTEEVTRRLAAWTPRIP
ncbi:MAG: Fe-S cluster assembly protein SufD [Elusimicrobia bacterium]|nr:Fe-S cluster assembly protein SufD [Elusimicrobiota bacterium]